MTTATTATTGLTLSFVKALAVSGAAPGKNVDIDVSRELGLELEETMYTNRLLALTNPGEYHKEREKKFIEMKTAAGDAYTKTLNSLLQTGLSTHEKRCKSHAVKLAVIKADNFQRGKLSTATIQLTHDKPTAQ